MGVRSQLRPMQQSNGTPVFRRAKLKVSSGLGPVGDLNARVGAARGLMASLTPANLTLPFVQHPGGRGFVCPLAQLNWSARFGQRR